MREMKKQELMDVNGGGTVEHIINEETNEITEIYYNDNGDEIARRTYKMEGVVVHG